jgi:hypothetical protein
VPVAVRLLLVRRDQLGQHSCERVHLVAAQLGPCGRPRRLFREDALEAEHEAEADLPARRGGAAARLDLGQRVVERAPASGAGRELGGRILVRAQERLARPFSGADRGSREAVQRLRRDGRQVGRCLHRGSASWRCVFL